MIIRQNIEYDDTLISYLVNEYDGTVQNSN